MCPKHGLVQLKRAIEEVRKGDEKAAEKAETVLVSQVKRVVNNRENADLVYEARKTISKTLHELKEKSARLTVSQ